MKVFIHLQLTAEEKAQVVTNCDHLRTLKFSPGFPHAFGEHGAIMAANVLRSPQAITMSVFVVRTFVKMRETLAGNQVLASQLSELQRKLTQRLDVHEKAIVQLFGEIRKLMGSPPPDPQPSGREIGFHARPAASARAGAKGTKK